VIGRLTGIVAERGSDGSCVIDVAGVGYEVFVPARMPLEDPPETVTLHVHTHVREDAIVLYGFTEPRARTAFRTVLGVSGIGPKLALALLSALSADDLAMAIAHQDRGAFKGISGIGKKTVDRLLLELRDKLPLAVASTSSGTVRAPAPRPSGPLATVAGALVQMGYKPAEAERAISAIGDPESKPLEELLREALVQLG
jgi:Holliday junction DNA helicase RuvA